jgi:NAD(P)H-dependent FMN reductase
MKLFLLAASLTSDSLNKKLISICSSHLKDEHTVDLQNFSDFQAPLYSADLEIKEGIPKNAEKFAEHILNADKIIFSVPEYNGSTPGAFKNMIDWISRIRPIPFKHKHILIISASPSNYGGSRAFLHTRVPLEDCGAFVYPRTFALATAHNIIDNDGKMIDTKLEKILHNLLEEFISK